MRTKRCTSFGGLRSVPSHGIVSSQPDPDKKDINGPQAAKRHWPARLVPIPGASRRASHLQGRGQSTSPLLRHS